MIYLIMLKYNLRINYILIKDKKKEYFRNQLCQERN